MYDTLWIGCSHSTGVYELNNELDTSRNNGIPQKIKRHYNQKWKIISCPGEGIFKYAQVIKTLEKHNMLCKFRNIIVQKTFEPRLTITEDETGQLRDVLDYIESDSQNTLSLYRGHLFPMTPLGIYELLKDRQLPKKADKVILDWTTELYSKIDPREHNTFMPSPWVEVCSDYIKDVAKRNKLNYYEFHWIRGFREILPVDADKPHDIINGDRDIVDWLTEQNLKQFLSTPGSHPTVKIVSAVSRMLIKELQKNGYE